MYEYGDGPMFRAVSLCFYILSPQIAYYLDQVSGRIANAPIFCLRAVGLVDYAALFPSGSGR